MHGMYMLYDHTCKTTGLGDRIVRPSYLQVPVDNSFVVAVVHSQDYLPELLPGLRFQHPTILDKILCTGNNRQSRGSNVLSWSHYYHHDFVAGKLSWELNLEVWRHVFQSNPYGYRQQ